MTEIKLCGMTRPADVQLAAELGVRYIGCVFAAGPRQQTVAQAVVLFQDVGAPLPGRVAVFADTEPGAIGSAVHALALEAVQLHGDPTQESVVALRQGRGVGAEIWSVVRCPQGVGLPARAAELWPVSDAIVLDAHVVGLLGGTGTTLAWSDLATGVAALRLAHGHTRLVVAGGLTPDNVGHAIAALRPDVVDVSSGIESAPGRKDPARMRAFVEAVSAADRALLPALS